MSRFYLTIDGGKSNSETVTRRGYSGNVANVAGWSGAIETHAYDRDGEDWVQVYLKPWHGSNGTRQLIYDGPLDASKWIVTPALVASRLPPLKLSREEFVAAVQAAVDGEEVSP